MIARYIWIDRGLLRNGGTRSLFGVGTALLVGFGREISLFHRIKTHARANRLRVTDMNETDFGSRFYTKIDVSRSLVFTEIHQASFLDMMEEGQRAHRE